MRMQIEKAGQEGLAGCVDDACIGEGIVSDGLDFSLMNYDGDHAGGSAGSIDHARAANDEGVALRNQEPGKKESYGISLHVETSYNGRAMRLVLFATLAAACHLAAADLPTKWAGVM